MNANGIITLQIMAQEHGAFIMEKKGTGTGEEGSGCEEYLRNYPILWFFK